MLGVAFRDPVVVVAEGLAADCVSRGAFLSHCLPRVLADLIAILLREADFNESHHLAFERDDIARLAVL
jgi:hypothetical protein